MLHKGSVVPPRGIGYVLLVRGDGDVTLDLRRPFSKEYEVKTSARSVMIFVRIDREHEKKSTQVREECH